MIARPGMVAVTLAAMLLSCGQDTQQEPPIAYATLDDCTTDELNRRQERGGVVASTDAPDLTKAEFESVLAVASDWAGDNCYLPCEFPMCGAVIDLKPGTVGVYIRPLDPLEGGIYPEAGVEIELSSMTVTAADLLHTGCQYWTGTCKPKWSGRQM